MNLSEELRRLGVAKVTIPFSGGNDEGGPDDIIAVAADGTRVTIPADSNAHQSTVMVNGYWQKGEWKCWAPTPEGKYTERLATPDEIKAAQLRDALTEPIYAEYGGFAGEFEVTGTLTWDVATGKSEMHGTYGTTHYEEF